ncbi:gp16 family protein [Geobacter anodireducens]|uniref:Regulatory protein GemA n=1 Tax=Geobacter anodireducens TaxID=1340425 RepID=A0ABR9NXK0_9BACT|nr:regulatory protein GemA [Geobacter anodireducens]MBE2888972.1 regulatory protein GemA [Geobacter anodireducens]
MGKSARKPSAHDRFRAAEIAKIHIAKSQLNLSEDIYRDIIREASRGKTESAADLDWRGRAAVLERFKELGWKSRHAGKAPGRPSRPLADYPEARMIRGLWIELHQLCRAGAAKGVRNPSEKALSGFVKRQTGVEDLEWLRRRGRVDHVIEALKAWLDRSRQECFLAWLATYSEQPLPDALKALLIHFACSHSTGAVPEEGFRPVLGEAGWYIYAAYAEYLQTIVKGVTNDRR